jgi:hypothetical protein
MNITVLYVGSSLLAPLKNAEREINRTHKLELRVAAYNFGSAGSAGVPPALSGKAANIYWSALDRSLLAPAALGQAGRLRSQ